MDQAHRYASILTIERCSQPGETLNSYGYQWAEFKGQCYKMMNEAEQANPLEFPWPECEEWGCKLTSLDNLQKGFFTWNNWRILVEKEGRNNQVLNSQQQKIHNNIHDNM